jgi:outer membrane receptor protein involved in Fe transport
VRFQLLDEISDKLSLRVMADVGRIDEACCGVVNLLNGPTGALIQAVGGRIYTGNPFDDSAYMNANPVNKVDNDGVSVHVDWKGSAVTISSITAVRRQQAYFDYDSDFTSADLVPTNINDQDIRTLTQEVRFVFDYGGPVSGMAGLYYLDESVELKNDIRFGAAFRGYATGLVVAGGGNPATFNQLEAALGLPANTFFAAGGGSFIDTRQDNRASTLFGQLDWRPTKKLTATFGLASTNSDKDVSMAQTNTDAFGQVNLVQVGFAGAFQALTGQPATPANLANPLFAPAAVAADAISVTPCSAAAPPPACNSTLALYPLQLLYPVVPFGNTPSRDDEVTYTFRLAYDANDFVRFYGGVSTGFKPTSWNLSRDSRPFPNAIGDRSPLRTRPNPYYGRYGTRFAGPEKSRVVEFGMKAKWARTSLNVALFEQDIEGFQSNLFVGTGFVLGNAGKESTTGLEVESLFALSSAVTLEFGVTLLDPLYDSFPGAQGVLPNGQIGVVDLSGTKPSGVSETSVFGGISYRYMAGSFASVFRADYRYDSDVQVVENVSSQYASRKVGTLNASVSFERKTWELQIWGRNLNDDRYLVSAFPSVAQSGSLSGYTNQPRQIGVTLRKSF